MKNKFNKIDESLDIESSDIEKEIIKSETSPSLMVKVGKEEDENKDYEYTRGNLYSLIEKGQQAISDILDVAQQSDSPRAYEVAGQLIKNVGDVTDKLIDLQQKMKKLKEEEEPKGPKSVTNNTMFIGSTAELQKLLKQNLPSAEDSK
jgi:hypothetical protein